MMSPESVYFAEQEFNRFEEIMNTKTYLTKEEYDFCFSYDKDIREDMSYIMSLSYEKQKSYSSFVRYVFVFIISSNRLNSCSAK
jgi:hypothetical protein